MRSASWGTPEAPNGNSSPPARPAPSRCSFRTPTRTRATSIWTSSPASRRRAKSVTIGSISSCVRSTSAICSTCTVRARATAPILMRVQLSDWRVDLLREMGLPFVMLGHTEEPVGASFIDYDFEAAVRIGLDHLVALGHRHIAYVSPMPSQESQHGPTMRALRAYTNACVELELPQLHYHADHDLRHIRLMTTNMLQEHPEITALVTMREMVETALFSAVHDAGLRVPDDISVLGLTTPHGPELTSPALTAMEFPAWSMAYEAGRMMIDELRRRRHDCQGDPLGSDPDRACEHEPPAAGPVRAIQPSARRSSTARISPFVACRADGVEEPTVTSPVTPGGEKQ